MSKSLLQELAAQNPLLVGAINDLCKAISKEPTHPEHATPPVAFLVGGYVRDLLLHQTPKDADVEVFGVEPARLQAILEHLFPGQIHDVGRAFGILKVHLSHGVEFDVAIPRTESKIAPGHKGFGVNTNPYLSVTEAARRRDFTVNAISLNPLTGDLVDPWNGQADLAKNLLRVVDPTTFIEDPLRVYRAMQFLARFELVLDPASHKLMQRMAEEGQLKELSAERITDEFVKLLLLAKQPSRGLEFLRELGIIDTDYPELKALIDTPQEPEWHPEGDVWIHTLLVVDQAAKIIRREENADFTKEEQLQAVLGALCHDFGKPAVTHRGLKNGVMRWRSPGHQEAGEAPTIAFCERLRLSESVVHAARMIALHHLRPGEYYLKKEKGELTDASYANVIRTLLKKVKPLSWRVLHASAEADFRGRGFPDPDTREYPYGGLFQDTIVREKLDVEALHPLVMGHELIELFKLEPGPYIGDLMRAIEHARDQGTLQTKYEALEFAKNLIKKRGHKTTST